MCRPVVENDVVLNFDFRNGAKKSGHFSHSFRASRFSFFLAGYHAQEHDLNVFLEFSKTIFTLKEWFLSKKGPKEGERVA